jgi:hypothetical protein
MQHLDPWLEAYQLRDIRPIIARMAAPQAPRFFAYDMDSYQLPLLKKTNYFWKLCLNKRHYVYQNGENLHDLFCLNCAADPHSPTRCMLFYGH